MSKFLLISLLIPKMYNNVIINKDFIKKLYEEFENILIKVYI